MILQVVHCPHCQGTAIVRHGQPRQGKQRYRCREHRGAGRIFLLDYSYRGQSSAVKEQSVDMAMNASGIRDTARVLRVSTNTVMTELKKGSWPPAGQLGGITDRATRASDRSDVPLRGTGSPAWTDCRARRAVVVCREEIATAVAVACH